MSPRLTLGLAATCIALAACASIVKLDAPDDVGAKATGDDDDSNADSGTLTTATGLAITPQSLTIKDGKCGEESSASITLKNGTDKAVDFTLQIADDPVFSLEGANAEGARTGTVPANGEVAVKVTAKPTAAGTSNVQIIVGTGEEVQTVDVAVETAAATLSVSPDQVDFGQVRLGVASEERTALFVNGGTQPLTITSFDATGDTGFKSESPVTLAAGEQRAVKFSMIEGPVDAAVKTATLTPVVEGPLCGAKPSVTLKGQRTDQKIIVSPTVDTGRVGCKTTPTASGKLTVSNYSPNSAEVTVTAPTKFSASSLGPITLQGAVGDVPKTAEITFVPLTSAVALDTPGPVEETVNVTVKQLSQPDDVRPVVVKTLVIGSVLSATRSYGYYSDLVDIPDNSTGFGTIKNSGNASTCLHFTMGGQSPQYFKAPRDLRAEAGKTYLIDVDFDASQNGTYRATLQWDRLSNCSGENAPICSGAKSIDVSGKRSSSRGRGGWP